MMIENIRYIKYSSSFKKDNYVKMAQFNCGDHNINKLFFKQTDKLHSTTYIFSDSNIGKIVSFLSFCTGAIQMHTKKGLLVLPAVELKLFGVDKDYQKEYISSEDLKLKYSEFTFLWLIKYIQKVVKPVVNVEYLILHSVPKKHTLKFYEKMGMKYFTENETVHSSDFSQDCIPMYLKI